MKRTEALELAIKAVKESSLELHIKNEVEHQLNVCMGRVAQIRWDEESIRAYCDRIYQREGRLTCKNFNHAGQPYRAVFRRVFGMTFTEFRDRYYPAKNGISQCSPYCGKSVAEWSALFVQEYRRLDPRSMEDYDARRSPGLPSWITIARMNHVTRWRDLLCLYGLEHRAEPRLSVTSSSHSEIAMLEIRKAHPLEEYHEDKQA